MRELVFQDSLIFDATLFFLDEKERKKFQKRKRKKNSPLSLRKRRGNFYLEIKKEKAQQYIITKQSIFFLQ